MAYKQLYQLFRENGWVTFTSCFLRGNSTQVIDPIVEYLKKLDRSRASTVNMKEVKDLALDEDTLEFLAYLHADGSRCHSKL